MTSLSVLCMLLVRHNAFNCDFQPNFKRSKNSFDFLFNRKNGKSNFLLLGGSNPNNPLHATGGNFGPSEADLNFNANLKRFLTMFTNLTDGIEIGVEVLVTFFMKTELSLSPIESLILTGVTHSPWFIKPIFAYFTDTVSFFGMKRKFYLGLGSAVHFLSWALLPVATTFSAAHGLGIFLPSFLLFTRNFGRILTVICSQAFLVQNLQNEEKKQIVNELSDFNFVRAFGTLSTSYFCHAFDLYALRPSKTLSFFMIFPLLIFSVNSFTFEAPGSEEAENLPGNFSFLQMAFFSFDKISNYLGEVEFVRTALLFNIICMLSPNYDLIMIYFYTDNLKALNLTAGDVFMRLQVMAGIAKISGPLLYKFFLWDFGYENLVKFLVYFFTPIYILPFFFTTGLHSFFKIPSKFLVINGEAINDMILHLQLMHPLVLSIQNCPVNYEATIFSVYSMIYSVGHAFSKIVSASILYIFQTKPPLYKGLSFYILFCAVNFASSLVFVKIVTGTEQGRRVVNRRRPLRLRRRLPLENYESVQEVEVVE